MNPDSLTDEDFIGFFRGVHGFDAYPWQVRLARQVIDTGFWPGSVELPTGAGKTALLDIAIFALAARPKVMPRRIVFVINRRTVVDQAYEHVEKIQVALEASDADPVRRVAGRLRDVCGNAPINGTRLRGGVHSTRSWADRPDTSWVTVATVDQFGSRLLFRAYGVGPKMRPVHAGLAGNDCLVILDEAHLERPFVETLRQVEESQPEVGGLPRRYQVVEMSATPAEPGHQCFRLDKDDLACPELVRRINAPKVARLWKIDWGKLHERIPSAVLEIIGELESHERTVGVVVNRVRTAREVHRALRKAGHQAHLLTGRMRPLDRDAAARAVQAAVDPARMPGTGELTFVVATQCIEVGADYSFDAMVTEVAPIDSLRQRFGRLDRRGEMASTRKSAARAWILGPSAPKTVAGLDDDPVYGGAVAATWMHLLVSTENGRLPFDAAPLAKHEFPAAAQAPRLEAPLLLPHHMDAWAQTNPEPAQLPPIDRFLHGMLPDVDARRPPDVSVVWRYDRSRFALREVPLRGVEMLQVPWRAAIAWLRRDGELEVSDAGRGMAQIQSRGTSLRGDASGLSTGDGWVRWTGHDNPPERVSSEEIQPGDVLIVDPTRGGLSHGTWNPSSDLVVSDLGDAAQHAYQQRFTLRLDPRLYPWLPRAPRPSDDAAAPPRQQIGDWLAMVATVADQPRWLAETVARLRESAHPARRVGTGPASYFIVSAGVHAEAAAMDGSDESQSVTGSGVSLRDHLEDVGRRVRAYAERLGLGPELCSDLELAARLHDIGKADPRFQLQMVGGDAVALECLEAPLAKTLPLARTDPTKWPGVFHEMLSALMARNSGRLSDAHDEDLVVHLVTSHHGRARSLPLLRSDAEPWQVHFSDGDGDYFADTSEAGPQFANDVAERFWCLTRRYGHHGLAWLEAILRQADQQQSASERAVR